VRRPFLVVYLLGLGIILFLLFFCFAKRKVRKKPKGCVHDSAYEVREGRCGMHVSMSKRRHLNMLPYALSGARARLDEAIAQPTFKLSHYLKLKRGTNRN
jgi:hypothetical protein